MDIKASKVSDKKLNLVLLGGSHLRGEVCVFLYDDDGKTLGKQSATFRKLGSGRFSKVACIMFILGLVILPGNYEVVCHIKNYAPLRQTIII